jgi:hypothetical protein
VTLAVKNLISLHCEMTRLTNRQRFDKLTDVGNGSIVIGGGGSVWVAEVTQTVLSHLSSTTITSESNSSTMNLVLPKMNSSAKNGIHSEIVGVQEQSRVASKGTRDCYTRLCSDNRTKSSCGFVPEKFHP